MDFVETKETRWNICFGKKPNPESGRNWVGSTKNWFNFAQIHSNVWQLVTVISVYFQPTETPLSTQTELSPKPPMSTNTETEISVYH